MTGSRPGRAAARRRRSRVARRPTRGSGPCQGSRARWPAHRPRESARAGAREHAEHEPAHVGPVERRQPFHASQLALQAHDRRRTDGEVEVGTAEPHAPGRGGRRAAPAGPAGRRGRPSPGGPSRPVAVAAGAGAIHLPDEAHELVVHRHHRVDAVAEVGLEGGQRLLVAGVVHGDDHAVVAPLERDREVAAGKVLGHQTPDVREDRPLGQVDEGEAELVGHRGGEVLLAHQLLGDEQLAQIDALGLLAIEQLLEHVARQHTAGDEELAEAAGGDAHGPQHCRGRRPPRGPAESVRSPIGGPARPPRRRSSPRRALPRWSRGGRRGPPGG